MTFATTGNLFRAIGVVAIALFGVVVASPAFAADQPKTPELVAAYVEDGLIPRLVDLYASGDGVSAGIDFDASTRVGAVSRVFVWTDDFLAGTQTDHPIQLTNDWVVPVMLRGSFAGLATVWINPSTNLPELADFDRGSALAGAISRAPAASLLVQDLPRSAWFAIDGEVLTPLVPGDSGVNGVTTPAQYQAALSNASPDVPGSAGPNGLLLAGIVLGIVVLLLAGFVLLPGVHPGDPDAAPGEDSPGGSLDENARSQPAVADNAGDHTADTAVTEDTRA